MQLLPPLVAQSLPWGSFLDRCSEELSQSMETGDGYFYASMCINARRYEL